MEKIYVEFLLYNSGSKLFVPEIIINSHNFRDLRIFSKLNSGLEFKITFL